jgi:hypothetical protein
MVATNPGGSLCLRLGVAHALRWLVFASVGLVLISAVFVAGVRSIAPVANWSSAWFDVAIAGFLFTSFLGIVVFQVAALRNRQVCVDGSELTVTGTFGKRTRFPRGVVDRVEQYRQITYVWSRFGTTLLLTRIVCTDGSSSNGLRLSARSARRFADFLGVRFVRAPSIWKTLIDQ